MNNQNFSVKQEIENTLEKLAFVGDALLANAPALSHDEGVIASTLLSDVTVKTMLLQNALPLMDRISEDEALNMTHELIAESNLIHAHFC
jgi:hypothetical protein